MEDSGSQPGRTRSSSPSRGIGSRKSEIGNSFPRAQRLKRRRLIRALFDRSRSDTGTVAVGTIRLIYRFASREEVGADTPLQVGFAPGGRARNAVERNRTRRLLREVFRTHQHILLEPLDDTSDILTLMVLFRGSPPPRHDTILRDLTRSLEKLADRLQQATAPEV